MQFRVEMPFVSAQVEWGSVTQWYVVEGQAFNFGDDLCDITITEVEHIDRRGRTRWHFAGKTGRGGDVRSTKRVVFDVRVTASEPAVVRSICAERGAQVHVGDLLAMACTDAQEAIDTSPAAVASALRVVANVVDPLGEQEGRDA